MSSTRQNAPVESRPAARSILARLSGAVRAFFRSLSNCPAEPALVPVGKRIAGTTIEEALHRFEDAFSEENFQNVAVLARLERPDGTLVRYEVRWKYSVLDDANSGRHESWALLAPSGRGADEARYRVAAATQDHHVKLAG